MSDTQSVNSLQWMVDAGVPKTDVMWLARVQGTHHLNHPVAARRVQGILDRATECLLATIKAPVPAMA